MFAAKGLVLLGCLLGWLSPVVDCYECQVVTREGTTNYGPGITEEAHAGLTPFPLGAYDAVIAFDVDHCIQMCCEELSCYVAVFDHTEAVCYLKGATAIQTKHFETEAGFTSHEMFFREGGASPMAMEPTQCQSKRGVAFDFKDANDLDALAPGMSWWYNWSPAIMTQDVKVAQGTSGTEYIPMIWGEKDLKDSRLANLDALGESSHLLGFNEPNFGAQASLTPAAAADLWSTVKSEAESLGADIVSPAVNFCGGDCNQEDPYQWLDEFFAACDLLEGGCGVTAIAVHSYTCEAKWLNKILHGYLRFGLPLWLTEFACADEGDKMTEEAQAAYLSDALTLLELHSSVTRYAWFTGRGGAEVGVAGSDLLSGAGELTQVGSVFVNTYKDLQKCEDVASSLTATPMAYSTQIAAPGTTKGLSDVNRDATEITNVVIGNLGGTGTYKEVVSMAPGANMKCTDRAAACVQEDVKVSGPLSPFDEGVSVAFRGPMNIHNIAWYEGERDLLGKTSTWTPTSSDNLVFMTNQGGSTGCSGEWSICGGSSQSYADASGNSCASEPEQFDGKLDNDSAVNIMTSTECAKEADCGFYRDTAMEGWTGGADGTKVMVFQADMPHCGTQGFSDCAWNRPAVWALNSKVVRTAQYGCNCRGAGGNGGCGEFDIVEAVIGVDEADMMFTTVYDFKGTGAPGHGKYFQRPSEPTHYAAIFRGGVDAYLQVVQLTDFDYNQESLSGAFLDSLRAASTENHDVYNVPADA